MDFQLPAPLPGLALALEVPLQVIVQHLHRSPQAQGNLLLLAENLGLLPVHFPVCHPGSLGGEALLHRHRLGIPVQQHRQFQRFPAGAYLPGVAVAVLCHFQKPGVKNHILAGKPGFQLHLPILLRLQLQAGDGRDNPGLGLQGVFLIQLGILGERNLKIPGVEAVVGAHVQHMNLGNTPEHHLVLHDLLVQNFRHQAIPENPGNPAPGSGGIHGILQSKGLFSRLCGQTHGIFSSQHLHILRDFSQGGQLPLLRHQSLSLDSQPRPDNELPGRGGTGVHSGELAAHADGAVMFGLGKLPVDGERQPGLDPPGGGTVLRGIEHKHHDPAGYLHISLPPLLAPDNGLSPGTQDAAHIRQILRQADLLGKLLIFLLPFHLIQAGNGLLVKL